MEPNVAPGVIANTGVGSSQHLRRQVEADEFPRGPDALFDESEVRARAAGDVDDARAWLQLKHVDRALAGGGVQQPLQVGHVVASRASGIEVTDSSTAPARRIGRSSSQ